MGKRTSNPKGVIGCTEEVKSPGMVCLRNNTIIEFRPHRGWAGEFGFDWLRIDDAPVPQQNPAEKIYKESILGSRKKHAEEAVDCPYAPAYEKLKGEYYKLDVNNHRAAPRDEYFIPWLNFYDNATSTKISDEYKTKTGINMSANRRPRDKARLRLLANVQGDRPDKVELEFPKEYFTIDNDNSGLLTVTDGPYFDPETPPINKEDAALNVEIACIKEFSEDQYINAWAYQRVFDKAEREPLEQENKQLSETDIPALNSEIETLEKKAQELEAQIQTSEAQIHTKEEPAKKLSEELSGLEEQSANETRLYMTLENLLQAHAALSDEERKTTEVADFQNLNKPGEREKYQAEINRLKAEIEKRELEIKEKKSQLEELQKQIEEIQNQITERRNKIEQINSQIAEKQAQIDEKNNKINENQKKIDEHKKLLAGKLCVCSNDEKHRKKLKIVEVSVVISLTGNLVDAQKGVFPVGEVDRLYWGLHQALVTPVIDAVELDLVTDKKFQNGGDFINPTGDLSTVPAAPGLSGLSLHKYLAKKLKSQAGNTYERHFKAFAIDLLCHVPAGPPPAPGAPPPYYMTSGQVQGIGKNNVIITRLTGAQPGTYIHEVLHGLGLSHTHLHSKKEGLPSNAKYVYYAPFPIGNAATYPPHFVDGSRTKTTDNIMSYSFSRYSTWHWQWEIMQKNV